MFLFVDYFSNEKSQKIYYIDKSLIIAISVGHVFIIMDVVFQTRRGKEKKR